jgi:hypothetical protein
MKIILCGWFSFKEGGSTAGDLMALDVVCRWLDERQLTYEVASAAVPCSNRVDWRKVEPRDYAWLVFICGPIVKDSRDQRALFRRFEKTTQLTAINVSMFESWDKLAWNPFHQVFSRDGMGEPKPDLSFQYSAGRVRVIGLILRGPQGEYGAKNCLSQEAELRIRELIESNPCSVVRIDTRIPQNAYGLRSIAEVESLISKMDVILTTRLHGAVLAIKNRVPVLAIDQIRKGAKVYSGLIRINWPLVFRADELKPHDPRLAEALRQALSPEIQAAIDRSLANADVGLTALKRCFQDFLCRE